VGALTVPLTSALAVALVSPDVRGRALALVYSGTAFAFMLGIPAGSLIGGEYGWQGAFWFAAGLSGVVGLLIALLVPAGAQASAPAGAKVNPLSWPLTGLYGATLLGFVATFSTVGLIGPLITALTGLTGGMVGALQVFIGVGSLAGLGLGAALAERRGPAALPVLFMVIALTQGLYAAALWAGVQGGAGLVLFALATLPGAAALFAIFPIVASALAARAGASATLAFAINGATIFLGQSLGVAVGGLGFGFGGLIGAALLGSLCGLLGLGFVMRLRSI